MKFLIQTLVATALLGTVFSAQATTYNLGELSTGVTPLTTINNGTIAVSPGTLNDSFAFSLAGTSDASFGVASFNYFWSLINGNFSNIDNFAATLYNSSNDLLSSGTDFAVLNLTAGAYHLDITGTANGLAGGLYTGGINVSPVPEVETSSMMLLGLGLMGFIARRRSVK